MSHSIYKLAAGFILLFVTLPVFGQELKVESDNAAQNKAVNQDEKLIKVFRMQNGDANELKSMIDALFQETDDSGDGLLQMRFCVDARTNSIIASGPKDDLQVIEALLARLEKPATPRQKTSVYRLKNAPVADVADAINQWLTECASIEKSKLNSGKYEVVEPRKCVIVPEMVSNSLIVSTSLCEEQTAEMEKLIRELDTAPDMVKIKVLLKKTVDGVETIMGRPHIITIEQQKGSLTFGSELEYYTVELTPYIIRNEAAVEVTEIPAQSKDR